MPKGLDTADGEAFRNARADAYGNCVVRMNLGDGVWTFIDRFSFIGSAIVYLFENLFVYSVMMRDTYRVFFEKTLIDFSLAKLLEGQDISNQRDVKMHVASKGNGAWCIVTQRLVSCTAAMHATLA